MARKKAAQSQTNQSTQRFAGKTFALTGRLEEWQTERVLQSIEGDGGRLVEEVTPSLDFLVVGKVPARKTSPEQKQAEQLNRSGAAIRIVALADFFDLFYPDRALAETLLRSGTDGVKRWMLLRGRQKRKLDLGGLDLRGAPLQGITLYGVNLDGADLSQTDLTNASLPEKLTGACLDGARLVSAWAKKLTDCSLRGVEASGVCIHEATLERTDCRRANLSCAGGVHLVARESIFREANLASANLYGADLRQCDLSGANLRATRLIYADLSGSNLIGAHLHKADLSQAKLKGADLRNADLNGADLFEADLRQARIEGANFEGAHVGGANLDGLDCGKARGLDPAQAKGPGRVGPNIKKLAQSAGQTARLRTSILVDLPDGGEVLLTLSASDNGKRVWLYRGRPGGLKDNARNLNVVNGLMALPRRWLRFTPRLDTVKVETEKHPRGTPELKELALGAWCEACGVPIPTTLEIKDQRKARKAHKEALYHQLLAELRGGPEGIRQWNERPRPLRKNAGSCKKIDLSGACLNGVDLQGMDFAGAVFDNADLTGADLMNGSFGKARFRQARLPGANLCSARCEGADFEGASLREGRLSGHFHKANFKNADLTGAGLSCADLTFVNLGGANLSGANLDYSRLKQTLFDEKTLFPSGFVPPKELVWAGSGPDPRLPPVGPREGADKGQEAGDFLKRLRQTVDPIRVDKALTMLKAERFQLFSQVDDNALVGVVRSQSNPDLVYSCRLASGGFFSCCTQNLRPCGGLRGALCKHLLVLIVGLTTSGQVGQARIQAWVEASRSKNPDLDRDAASAVLLRHKGAEAGEVDWRPTETIPEDYYAL